MDFKHKNKKLQFFRYPESSNKSLRPWSAADELIVQHVEENHLINNKIAVLNDKFGFLSTVFFQENTFSIIECHSQEKAIKANFLINKILFSEENLHSIFEIPKELDLVLLKVPKSMELFEFYLAQVAENSTTETNVICGFMTRNFTSKMVELAEKYFKNVSQSKAHKKARLLLLKTKKTTPKINFINTISFENKTLKQYSGVFSSNHIDYATQFLLTNLKLKDSENIVLDLASGNGIISAHIREQKSNAELHLVDDSILAIASSKLNISDENTFHHNNDSLEEFQSNFFNLIITNPPFHFEYETNIDVSLQLFKESKRCLKKNGRFLVVANQHLNYKTHLIKLFSKVDVVAENDKFIIYENSNKL